MKANRKKLCREADKFLTGIKSSTRKEYTYLTSHKIHKIKKYEIPLGLGSPSVDEQGEAFLRYWKGKNLIRMPNDNLEEQINETENKYWAAIRRGDEEGVNEYAAELDRLQENI